MYKKRKICIYCEKWTMGGIETFLAKTLLHINREGLEFHLAVAEWQPGVFQDALEKAEVSVHVLQKQRRAGACGRTLYSLKNFRKLLRQESFDVVHLNIFHGAALALAFLARREKVHTVIVHSHGAALRKSRGYRFKLAAHRFCRMLFAWTPTTRWAASASAGRFLFPKAENIQWIPNGVDTQQFLFSAKKRQEIREQLALEGCYVIGCVGRLEPQKNQMFLLEALRECLRKRPETVLLLVGDGEARAALERKASGYGLTEHVRFTGMSDQVPALMCAMDVLAVPSLSEGLGIAVIEGQASGLPVVCSSGVPEEARITDAVSVLHLEQGEKAWAEQLLAQPPRDRIRQNELVRNSLFEIGRSAEIVRGGYMQR